VCIIGAIFGGIAIARPTIKKITGIYNTVNKSKESMKNVIDASSVVSLNVSNMATELAASASEVNASTEEIASSTTEVAQNIGSQVNSLSQISTRSRLIEELSKEILSSTDDINKIVKLITSISDQTNLLALNASIEAGRAGEHGRGFAVVADEVRKLAEESKSSIATTGEKINLIISRITESNKYVAEITQDIQLSTASFEDTSQAIEGISSSAEEQTASMEEISATAAKLGAIAEELKTTLLKEREVTNKTSTSAGRIKK
jgi:methyl-accepting chemotaxis protein